MSREVMLILDIQVFSSCAVVALSHRSIAIARKYRGRITKGVNSLGKIIANNNDNKVTATNKKSLIMIYLLEFTPFVVLSLPEVLPLLVAIAAD